MNWLDRYTQELRAQVPARRQGVDLEGLRAELGQLKAPRDLVAALRRGGPAVLAEIKFRSPSKGVLRPALDVEFVAQGYARAGAAALSVLVDGPHFGGDPTFLARAKAVVDLPVLAKGFFVDPLDVLELRRAGADALLLIARCLDRETLAAMLEESRALGMAALVEVHDLTDLAKVAGLPLDLVGVNHRDLGTLDMDRTRTRTLVNELPAGAVKVAESGLKSVPDLLDMKQLGYDAVLIGSAFMAVEDPGEALASLLRGLRC